MPNPHTLPHSLLRVNDNTYIFLRMDIDDVRAELRRACEVAGSQLAWATTHKVSPQYVCGVLRGKLPGWQITHALRIEKVVTYRWIDGRDGV